MKDLTQGQIPPRRFLREPKLKARAVWLVLAIFAFGIPVAIADTGAVEKQVFETLLQQAKNGDAAAQFIVGMTVLGTQGITPLPSILSDVFSALRSCR